MLPNRQPLRAQRNHRKDIRRFRPHFTIFPAYPSSPTTTTPIRRNLIQGINLRKSQCPRHHRHHQFLFLNTIPHIRHIRHTFCRARQIRIKIHWHRQRSRNFTNPYHPAIHTTMIKIINTVIKKQ